MDKIISQQHKNWNIPFLSTGMSTLLHAPIQALGQQTEVCEGFNFLVLKISVSKVHLKNLIVKTKNVNCLKNKPSYSHKILLKVNILF